MHELTDSKVPENQTASSDNLREKRSFLRRGEGVIRRINAPSLQIKNVKAAQNSLPRDGPKLAHAYPVLVDPSKECLEGDDTEDVELQEFQALEREVKKEAGFSLPWYMLPSECAACNEEVDDGFTFCPPDARKSNFAGHPRDTYQNLERHQWPIAKGFKDLQGSKEQLVPKLGPPLERTPIAIGASGSSPELYEDEGPTAYEDWDDQSAFQSTEMHDKEEHSALLPTQLSGLVQPLVRSLFQRKQQHVDSAVDNKLIETNKRKGTLTATEGEGERLKALEEEMGKVQQEKSFLLKMRTDLEKAANRLEQERKAMEKRQVDEAAALDEWRTTESQRLARDRRILEKQSRSLLSLPNKKERSAVAAAEAALEVERKDSRAKEARHKLTVERLRRQIVELQERNNESRDEVRWYQVQLMSLGWVGGGQGSQLAASVPSHTAQLKSTSLVNSDISDGSYQLQKKPQKVVTAASTSTLMKKSASMHAPAVHAQSQQPNGTTTSLLVDPSGQSDVSWSAMLGLSEGEEVKSEDELCLPAFSLSAQAQDKRREATTEVKDARCKVDQKEAHEHAETPLNFPPKSASFSCDVDCLSQHSNPVKQSEVLLSSWDQQMWKASTMDEHCSALSEAGHMGRHNDDAVTQPLQENEISVVKDIPIQQDGLDKLVQLQGAVGRSPSSVKTADRVTAKDKSQSLLLPLNLRKQGIAGSGVSCSHAAVQEDLLPKSSSLLINAACIMGAGDDGLMADISITHSMQPHMPGLAASNYSNQPMMKAIDHHGGALALHHHRPGSKVLQDCRQEGRDIWKDQDVDQNAIDHGSLLSDLRHADGRAEKIYSSGLKCIQFMNGTRKISFPNGRQIIRFTNGDIKLQHASQRAVDYFYAEISTWHTTFNNGLEVFHFPNGQTEVHNPDGVKDVVFADGHVRRVLCNGHEVDLPRDMLSQAALMPVPSTSDMTLLAALF
ncbi:hypothetical protein CEUSTIGMA_g11896.t1 [Chlamydomonas eustigma]|uniref:Centromere protein J C-terminal domain-containing protein n=1 Tax=Chlamydomonas eustigma TaxID=1157962 RepID=A0A250XN83_9CHLO|nr:hypothetical protein CEUSTIGMA_g11896.t1 [Chlamydomonas eustigma]|eukprot:GAX84476.1 hypothetical protein CEUSTIGMA_g11896.t1 [Chlamydomonas eustigma]